MPSVLPMVLAGLPKLAEAAPPAPLCGLPSESHEALLVLGDAIEHMALRIWPRTLSRHVLAPGPPPHCARGPCPSASVAPPVSTSGDCTPQRCVVSSGALAAPLAQLEQVSAAAGSSCIWRTISSRHVVDVGCQLLRTPGAAAAAGAAAGGAAAAARSSRVSPSSTLSMSDRLMLCCAASFCVAPHAEAHAGGAALPPPPPPPPSSARPTCTTGAMSSCTTGTSLIGASTVAATSTAALGSQGLLGRAGEPVAGRAARCGCCCLPRP